MKREINQSKPLATSFSVQIMALHVTSSYAILHLAETWIPQNHDPASHNTGFQWLSPRGEI
jgi:hypothetical protein